MQAVDLEVSRPAVIWPEPLTVEEWEAQFGPKSSVAGHGD
jgi:hypothetical protein